MSDFFLGQVMMTGFGFPPKFFAQCNGAQLPTQQNQALFSLLGYRYGGSSAVFNLPDLRGRQAVGGGASSRDPSWQPSPYSLGSVGGGESVALTADQNPSHTHQIAVDSAPGTSSYLDGNMTLAAPGTGATIYGPPGALLPLGAGATSLEGTGLPHANMQPFQAINFNIVMNGIFPTRG